MKATSRLLLGLLCCAAPVGAGVTDEKRIDLPGYAFEQFTDDADVDRLPRVSRSGLVAWSSTGGAPGTSSGTDDLEILLWDGVGTFQITDNDGDDRRAVVNDAGDVTWMDGFGLPPGEVYVRRGGITTRLTTDPLPGIRDRYPDINDNGVVVWPREFADGWHVMVNDPRVGPGSWDAGRGYRPHLNNADRYSAADDYALRNLQGLLVTGLPDPEALGYLLFRRGEINDLDQMALEADLLPVADPDYTGARDILFWDGSELTVLYRSRDVWHGRPDLNSAGTVVWEGFGGLPGSRSGPDDAEIFVFRPESGVILQLTDDDWADIWPTIDDNGTVVWQGTGNYPGATSSKWDREIFRAFPNTDDLDSDGIVDASDNCPLEPNPSQLNNPADPDPERGDACQCGDVTGDGVIGALDRDTLRLALAGGVGLIPAPRLCGLVDPALGCSIVDAVVLARALADPSPASPALRICVATSPLL